MAAGFQVFVERAASPAPDALERLAAAMAERYGLPRNELEPRLRAGRFRVKSNVDRATAEKFAADLEKLGAIVSVTDLDGVALTRAGAAAAAPPPRAKPVDSKPPQFSSGLAAAFGEHKTDDPDLGALGDTSSTFALSALDGTDDADAAPSGSFAPPSSSPSSSNDALPASIGPAILPQAPAKPAPRVSSEPIDMFAPPEAEAEVDLAVEMPAKKRGGAASMPPPAEIPRASGHLAQLPEPSAPAIPKTTLGDRLRTFAAHRRARFATGAVLAVLIGFLPAHLLASVREHSAYAEIDAHLAERSSQVRTMEQYQALDSIRAASADEKLAEKHSIALTAVLVWAAVSAGFAYAWFRAIDWDRLAAR